LIQKIIGAIDRSLTGTYPGVLRLNQRLADVICRLCRNLGKLLSQLHYPISVHDVPCANAHKGRFLRYHKETVFEMLSVAPRARRLTNQTGNAFCSSRQDLAVANGKISDHGTCNMYWDTSLCRVKMVAITFRYIYSMSS
jgi:hypothetical protein